LVESTLFRFKVKLAVGDPVREIRPGLPKKMRVEVDMLPELDLDYDILEDQMQDLPGQYAFWSAVYSESRFWATLAERGLKAAKGKAIKKVQDDAAKDNVRLTADQVKMVLEAEDSVKEADAKLATLQMQTGKLYHMVEALKMKAELARSLSGFKRQEYDKST